LDRQEYEALIGFARQATLKSDGQVDHEKALRLDMFLQSIEKKNGITRHIIWVQWQELDAPLPPNTRFPDVWPPNLRIRIEQVTRPISRADIDQVLAENAKKPISVLFTRDPGARYGWTELDQYT
jgi:hypothetical protein